MRIKDIELNSFKFHKNLKFNIEQKNCLIYGENGVGKSSIYWGLYSVFKKDLINIDDYKNYNSTTPPNVKVTLDDSFSSVLGIASSSDIVNNNSKSIYFAYQDFLENIVIKDNFYEAIDSSLKSFFPTLLEYVNEFNRINNDIEERNHEEEAEKRKINIQKSLKFLYQILLRANDIINNHFEENFSLSFGIDWGMSQLAISGEYAFSKPKVNIQIDGQDNLKLNFNEAKLKLVAIAIFFALIKLEEDENNSFKLLVLDDFLTSLDMANRKLIIQYILDNFEEYQKIILTHNIQFYNLIIRLLKMRDEVKDWDIKNIFIRSVDNSFEALIYNKETNYIKEAENYLKENKLNEAGIYLRKEFERVVDELRQKNEVGAKEKMGNIIEQIVKLDSTTDINIKKMQKVLKQTKFYQESLLHSTAHNDIDRELYTKELNGAIVILKQLNKFLNVLRD